MTIHLFTGKDSRSATARLRGILPARELLARGVFVKVYPPPSWRPAWRVSFERVREFYRHAKILLFAPRKDVIFLVRTIYQIDFVFLVLCARIFFRKKYVFDFDDAIYEKPWCRYRARLLTRFASAVTVGNHHLEKWAKSRNGCVSIIPTAIPFDIYVKFTKLPQTSASGKIVIGWIGNGINHLKNLKLLVPVFERLVSDGVNFRFVLVGGMEYRPLYDLFDKVPGLEVQIVDELDWSDPESAPTAIAGFDIGVMPLVSDTKTIGKSALKAVEYMACSVPPVVSPVGENGFLVQDGENGFVASSTREWVEKLKLLAADADLRQKLGAAAQAVVRQNYSYEVIIPKLITIFQKV